MNKICRKCNFEGDETLFAKMENLCKECRKIYNKQYKKQYKKDRSTYLKQYYINNKDHILSQQDQYYENNKEKILLRQKQYDDTHENIIVYRKQYRKDNVEKQKKYRQTNKVKLRKYHNEYMKERKKNDPAFKLRGNCSKLIYYALKGTKSRKSILQYLPYSIEELKQHLENQFDDNMTWENYGSYWHMDHIIPQSLLPFTSMEDENFKKCWSLSNLQPLEKIANIKKGNKLNSLVNAL
jgi:hypothetical protein